MGDRPSIFGRGRARGRVWYPVKVLHVRQNLFAGTEMLSLSVYEPIAKTHFAWGTVPQFRGGVELGGRVWYLVKVLHIT